MTLVGWGKFLILSHCFTLFHFLEQSTPYIFSVNSKSFLALELSHSLVFLETVTQFTEKLKFLAFRLQHEAREVKLKSYKAGDKDG